MITSYNVSPWISRVSNISIKQKLSRKSASIQSKIPNENISRAYEKYVQAGRLAAEAYYHALNLAKMKSDVTLAELSEAGDKYIKDRSVSQINDGEILRSKGDYESGRYTGSLSAQTLGICHPTTAQLDYIICNNALKTGNPLKAEGSQLLKLQVGAHIDVGCCNP